MTALPTTPISTKPEPTGIRPFSGFEWMMALRYLRARRKEGYISVIAVISAIAIMLSVAMLIIVMSVMNGLRTELLAKALGFNGHVIVAAIETPFTDYDAVTERIRAVPGVTYAAPIIERQALASSPYAAGGVQVRGMRGQDLMKMPSIATNIVEGTLEGFDTSQGVMIGRRLATDLGLRIGDTLTLASPRGAVTAFGTTPRIKAYRIAALFEVGMSRFDGAVLFMPLSEAQLYFNQDGTASSIEVFVADPDAMDDYNVSIDAATQRPVALIDWRQRDRAYFSALIVERNVTFIVFSVMILIATFNIISGLILLVKDKNASIAIMRTMGATRGTIMRIFLIAGPLIGIVGTLAGFLLGVVFCWNIDRIKNFVQWLTGSDLFPAEVYYLAQLPADLNPREVGAIVAMSITMSLLATIYPSYKAARLDPVEALRYE